MQKTAAASLSLASSIPALALVVCALGGAGCRPAVDPAMALLEQGANLADELTLGPGDKFDIRVFGEPDFTGTYRVDSDGTILYPFIGTLRVEGMKPNQLAREMTSLLGDKYLRHPQVSVLIQEQVSKKITVIGQVIRPGTFPYTTNMNVVEAITLAGGFTPIASRDKTKITRSQNGQKITIEVAAGSMGEGRAANIPVRPGDIISVPERIF